MKYSKIISLVILSVMLFSCTGNAQNNEQKTETVTNKIEVIDFHSTRRCMTCNAIEENTKFTLNNYFAKELESGKITFQSINVDDEKNYEMALKYEAAGTSLFLNVVISGEETQIDITNFAFQNGRNQEVFAKKLKNKIEVQLTKM
jgi:hypothetical protein